MDVRWGELAVAVGWLAGLGLTYWAAYLGLKKFLGDGRP
jgi:hypothetical protein